MRSLAARFARLFDRRYRGFRVVELGAFGVFVTLVLGVYAFKADAGREGARLADVDRQVGEERARVKLLTAEIARLEQPERLQRLSTAYLGLGPAEAKREAGPDSLPDLAHHASVGAAR